MEHTASSGQSKLYEKFPVGERLPNTLSGINEVTQKYRIRLDLLRMEIGPKRDFVYDLVRIADKDGKLAFLKPGLLLDGKQLVTKNELLLRTVQIPNFFDNFKYIVYQMTQVDPDSAQSKGSDEILTFSKFHIDPEDVLEECLDAVKKAGMNSSVWEDNIQRFLGNPKDHIYDDATLKYFGPDNVDKFDVLAFCQHQIKHS